jgi:hypothetical protein
VLGQDGFEFLDRIVREGCHRSEKADRLAHCNHMVKLFVLYLASRVIVLRAAKRA